MKPDSERRLELEEGDVVQYTNKSLAVVVEITSRDLDGSFVRYEAEVLEDPIVGEIDQDTFTFGCTEDKSLHHYVTWKVKEPWEMPQYIRADSVAEIDRKLSKIEEKYKD